MAWMLIAILACFIQWPGLSFDTSIRQSWVVISILAVVLLNGKHEVSRSVRLWTALIVVYMVIQYVFLIHPALVSSPMLGWWSIGFLCPILLCLATLAVLSTAPPFTSILKTALACVLAINILFVLLQTFDIWSRWLFDSAASSPSGLFAHPNDWAAWCAIALPLLGIGSIWAIIGLFWAHSSSAIIAVCLAFLLAKRREYSVYCVPVLLITGCIVLWAEPDLLKAIQYRLNTWGVALEVIAKHPFGIGFKPMAYTQAILQTSATQVIPHPASDVLGLFMRIGWVMILPFAWILRWLFLHGTESRLALCLTSAFFVACFQGIVGRPTIFLVWLILTAYLVEKRSCDA